LRVLVESGVSELALALVLPSVAPAELVRLERVVL